MCSSYSSYTSYSSCSSNVGRVEHVYMNTPPHGLRGGAESKVMTESLESGARKGFSKNVGSVVVGADANDFEFIEVDKFTCRVVLDTNMFRLGVPALVLGELPGRFAITVEMSGFDEKHV